MLIFKQFRFDSSLSILDCMSMGPTLLLQSFAWLELSAFVFGLSCSGLFLLAPDFVMMGSLAPLQSFAYLGLPLFVYGMTCPGSSLFALDFVHMGLFLSSKTFA